MVLPKEHIVSVLAKNNVSGVDFGYDKFSIIVTKELKIDGEPCWGHIDIDKAEIHLEYNMDFNLGLVTLLHECLHAIVKITGISLFGKEDKVVLNEEQLVRQLERGLLLFKKLNPNLTKVLFCD